MNISFDKVSDEVCIIYIIFTNLSSINLLGAEVYRDHQGGASKARLIIAHRSTDPCTHSKLGELSAQFLIVGSAFARPSPIIVFIVDNCLILLTVIGSCLVECVAREES